MKQLNAARALSKKYGEKAVLSAINSQEFNKYLLIGLQNGRGWKINPKIEPIIAKHKKILEEQAKLESHNVLEVVENTKRRTLLPTKKRNTLNKLRGLDGKKEES